MLVLEAISFNNINWHSHQRVLSKWKIKKKNAKKTNCCPKCFKSHKILTCCQLSEPYKVMIYGKIPSEWLYHNNRHNSITSASKVISAEHIRPFNSKHFLTRKCFCDGTILTQSQQVFLTTKSHWIQTVLRNLVPQNFWPTKVNL